MDVKFLRPAQAALFVCVSTAVVAAEKPARKAKPADRNRICASQGEGFIYSPSSDSCIRVGGGVSTEFSGGAPAWGITR